MRKKSTKSKPEGQGKLAGPTDAELSDPEILNKKKQIWFGYYKAAVKKSFDIIIEAVKLFYYQDVRYAWYYYKIRHKAPDTIYDDKIRELERLEEELQTCLTEIDQFALISGVTPWRFYCDIPEAGEVSRININTLETLVRSMSFLAETATNKGEFVSAVRRPLYFQWTVFENGCEALESLCTETPTSEGGGDKPAYQKVVGKKVWCNNKGKVKEFFKKHWKWLIPTIASIIGGIIVPIIIKLI